MFLRRKQFTFGSLHGVSILWRTDMLQTYYIYLCSTYYIDTRTFWHSLYDMLTHCGLMHQITIHWRIRLWHFPPVKNLDSKNSELKFPENISRYHLISKSWQRNWMWKGPWKVGSITLFLLVFFILRCGIWNLMTFAVFGNFYRYV